jgi:hypothetical protein
MLISWMVLPSSSQVFEAWVNRYNGPENSQDYPVSLSVDNVGNIYVTGRSYSENSHSDYATVKYDSTGKEVWVALYNGSGNDTDLPHALSIDNESSAGYALKVDKNGNVHVTGGCGEGWITITTASTPW